MILFGNTGILGSIFIIIAVLIVYSRNPKRNFKRAAIIISVIFLLLIIIGKNVPEDAPKYSSEYAEDDSEIHMESIPDSLTYATSMATLDSLAVRPNGFYKSYKWDDGWLVQGLGIRDGHQVLYYLFYRGTYDRPIYHHAKIDDLDADKIVFDDSPKE